MTRLLALALLLAAAEPASAQLDALNSRFERRRAGGGAFPAAVVSTRPHPAVCRIIVPNRDGTSFGTGTLVDVRGKHGLVLTNWHVVHEASGPIEVVFPDGFRTPGHVHKVDKDWDLAALAVYRPNTSPVSLSNQVPREGDRFYDRPAAWLFAVRAGNARMRPPAFSARNPLKRLHAARLQARFHKRLF